ncbi:hypothetical protein B0G76_5994 [Paraburkholderia sp. BL23I1N1]|nr:hypothetical protein B0G76_5994 [Paraburkholderia sp. BL23I1N1]
MTELAGTLMGIAALAISTLLLAGHHWREHVRERTVRGLGRSKRWDAFHHRR